MAYLLKSERGKLIDPSTTINQINNMDDIFVTKKKLTINNQKIKIENKIDEKKKENHLQAEKLKNEVKKKIKDLFFIF